MSIYIYRREIPPKQGYFVYSSMSSKLQIHINQCSFNVFQFSIQSFIKMKTDVLLDLENHV